MRHELAESCHDEGAPRPARGADRMPARIFRLARVTISKGATRAPAELVGVVQRRFSRAPSWYVPRLLA
jgi:hypothetical protein